MIGVKDRDNNPKGGNLHIACRNDRHIQMVGLRFLFFFLSFFLFLSVKSPWESSPQERLWTENETQDSFLPRPRVHYSEILTAEHSEGQYISKESTLKQRLKSYKYTYLETFVYIALRAHTL